MRTVDVAREIDADPDDAWDLLVDTRRWPEWGPSVTAVECSNRRLRAGSIGRVRTPVGVWIPFGVPVLAVVYRPVCRRALDRIERLLEGAPDRTENG